MALTSDLLSLVVEYMDSLESTTCTVRLSDSSRNEEAAECRRVNRAWRGVVDGAIDRGLPRLSPESLAAMLAPGRLRAVLLCCRYASRDDDHQSGSHENATMEYDRLVKRAETCAMQLLRGATSQRGTAEQPFPREKESDAGSGTRSGSSGRLGAVGGLGIRPSTRCCRVALMRVVGRALASPCFAWCSTLGSEDSRLLEGCVGSSALLHARWCAV